MELVRLSSRGGLSVRSIVTFVLTVVITALLWVTFASSPANAQEASWNGAALTYDSNQYVSAGKSLGTESHKIPEDASLYIYLERTAGTNTNQINQKAHVIYFAPGADPPTATAATYITFTYDSTTEEYSNPSSSITIDVDSSTANSGSTSCAIEGVGWIVCQTTRFLAWGMDTIFELLSGFLEVQPLQTGSISNGLYQAWNIMRGFANIAFIIVFLIIIYSQLTNIAVSNYGLKRLLPRLIIAAIAVNVSYILSALAVDVSNILGYSLQEMFLAIRSDILATSTTGVHLQVVSWESIAGFVLSGGTAALALGVGTIGALTASGGTITGLIFLILPALLGLLLTVLVVLIILAARQALITILVIIAPFAIVAYLLPNTEKWFGKWRDLFMTMLIFFPAFSVVFGGSQLAGTIIIYNADSINMIILGMIVQVAPLVITPLLLKFSGSLLGRIAQIANNPNKGLLDRTRNWSKAHVDANRQRGIGGTKRNGKPGELGKFSGMRKSARYLDQRKMVREARMKNATTATQTAFENSRLYKKNDLAGQTAAFEEDKNATHSAHLSHVEKLKVTPGSLLHDRARNAEAQKQISESAQADTAAYYNRLRINPATELGAAAKRLEASKLHSEGWQNKYTEYVENQKLESGTPIQTAAKFAQSSKEHSEAAQGRVQAMFDSDRRIKGTQLNVSMKNLEGAKLEAETEKNLTTRFISDAKSNAEGFLHVQNTKLEASKAAVKTGENELAAVIKEYAAMKDIPESTSVELTNAIATIRDETQAATIQSTRAGNADKVINEEYGNTLIANQSLREQAGGINKQGADAALASAINTVRTAYAQSVNEGHQIIKHFNLSAKQRQKLSLLEDGEQLVVQDGEGRSYTFNSDNDYAREAAIEDQIATGTIPEVEEIVQESGTNSRLAKYRTTIADALGKSGLSGKSLYLGGKTIDDVGQGIVSGPEGILSLAVSTIGRGKISQRDLATIDPIAVERLLEAAQRIKAGDFPEGIDANDPEVVANLQATMVQFSEIARKALTGDERVAIKGKAMGFIEQIGQLTDPNFKAPSDSDEPNAAPTPQPDDYTI